MQTDSTAAKEMTLGRRTFMTQTAANITL